MNMAIPESPHAFPVGNLTEDGYNGMTLRDYFAGQAIPAAAAEWSNPETIAYRCYAVADAMLRMRG